MKVLFVSTAFPNDLRRCVHGVYKRAQMFIDAIREIAQISVLYYVPPGVDASPRGVAELRETLAKRWGVDLELFLCPRNEPGEELSKWARYGAGIFHFHRQGVYRFASGPSQLDALEAALQSAPDIVFAHRLASMCPLLLTGRKLPRVLFDLDDVEHMTQIRLARRMSKLRDKALSYMYVPTLLLGERRAIRLADQTFVCSHADRLYLSEKWRLPGIATIPNAIDAPEECALGAEPNILFLGNFGYEPNVQAAEYLIREIWPLVRKASSQARLIMAGDCSDRISGLAPVGSGVELTGFVDDLEALYRRSKVVVVPILAGSGTRIKIIEAAAHGKPVVSTSIGAEGLEMRDESELLIRDDAGSFAAACIRLLENDDLCRSLGRAARTVAVANYDRRNVIRLIQDRLRNAFSKRHAV